MNLSMIEECKEKFLKSCTIEYNAVPKMEKVEVCHQPMVRNCSIQGEEVCSDEYETVCDTQYHENEVEDDIPQCETIVEEVCDAAGKCTKVPRQECSLMKMNSTRLTPETDCRQEIRQVCGPEACPLTRGPKICAQEVKTFVQEVPEEICHLNPQKVCSPVSKIVPRLELEVKCIDVPREVCSTVQVEAKKVQRPTVKKWCGPTAAAAAVAMETWRAFHSQDGPSGSRNALGQVLFPSNVATRSTRSEAAGVVSPHLPYAANTVVDNGIAMWNKFLVLREFSSKRMASNAVFKKTEATPSEAKTMKSHTKRPWELTLLRWCHPWRLVEAQNSLKAADKASLPLAGESGLSIWVMAAESDRDLGAAFKAAAAWCLIAASVQLHYQGARSGEEDDQNKLESVHQVVERALHTIEGPSAIGTDSLLQDLSHREVGEPKSKSGQDQSAEEGDHGSIAGDGAVHIRIGVNSECGQEG
eukprot:snap_masked-scaffold931_size79642-processed-gene-0.8 protein:Tk04726 transcript:snap_masked-scaffold931_size79642-processed-gene-0.8-mRNA-1 annotation:"hypothetical protein"